MCEAWWKDCFHTPKHMEQAGKLEGHVMSNSTCRARAPSTSTAHGFVVWICWSAAYVSFLGLGLRFCSLAWTSLGLCNLPTSIVSEETSILAYWWAAW